MRPLWHRPSSLATPVWVVLGLLPILWGAPGCGRPASKRDPASGGADPRRHASSAVARHRALAVSHREVRKRLGAHVFRAKHQVASSVDGKPERAWVDTYELRCRANGDCHGRHDNSLEYGVEFVRIGEQTYFRHRYQSFLRFREEPREAEGRVERIWGSAAAVTELLGRWLHLEPAGQAKVAGRAGHRYTLSRRKGPRSSSGKGRRAWRARLQAETLTGEVVLDSSTGVPLKLLVRYAVWATRGRHKIALKGTFEGGLSQVGAAAVVVAPPKKYAQATPRLREALQERRLLRGQRLHPGWFRGGGPHEARRRRRGRGTSRRGMGAASPRRPRPGSPARPRARAGAR